MDLFLSLLLFVGSLTALIVATEYFLRSAGHLGRTLGVSPFVVGALIIAFGTSLPEATIALFSVWNGVVDIPVAQTVGSNIANILLVLGVVAIIIRRLVITKNLADVELSLILAVTLLFVLVSFDRVISFTEGLFLVAGFICYIAYVFLADDHRNYPLTSEEQLKHLSFLPKNLGVFLVAIIVIAAAAHSTIIATQSIAFLFGVPEGLVAITALALGTSLPELVVSIQAALRKEVEIIVGNIIGSNIFNILFVVGIPALITDLTLDQNTLSIGIPALIGVTALFIVSSLSNRIHIWEGLFYVLLYLLLMVKLFGTL